MKKSLLILLVSLAFIPMFGCYTQLVTEETVINVPDSAIVNVTNNYDIEYVGYGYRYPGLTSYDYGFGYSPYWYYDYPSVYPGYLRPYRPFIWHRPVWRFPFHYNPPKHFGNNWQIIKPTNPPKHGKEIGREGTTRKESVRDAIIRRVAPTARYIPQRVYMPQALNVRSGDAKGTNSSPRQDVRTYSPPPTHNTPTGNTGAPAPNSGGSRSSGATRTGNR